MRDLIHLSDFGFSPAPPQYRRKGLLGWVSCTLNGRIALDGIALRRTVDGALCVSFPARRDREGRNHYFVRPLDAEARRELEEQIIEAIRRDQGWVL